MKRICLILALIICASCLLACDPKGPADEVTDTEKVEDSTVKTTKVTTTQKDEEEEEPPVTIDIDYGTANMREEGKEYHIESVKVPTNNKNIDKNAGYLIDDHAQSNESYRYCDGSGYVIYEIDISEMIEPTVDIEILQNYLVSIAAYDDFDCYKVIYDFSEEHPSTLTSGGNDVTYTIDPYEHGFYKVLYILIEDTNASDGWGGTIRSLTINQYVEGEGEDVLTTLE